MLATVLFALALIHTFGASKVLGYSHRFPKDSIRASILHLLSEVEVVFGFWAAIYLILTTLTSSGALTLTYLKSLSFHEPVFVFVVMLVAATRPIREVVEGLFFRLSWLLWKILKKISATSPISTLNVEYLTCLSIGPLLGSLITEPAAMTASALFLKNRILPPHPSVRCIYTTLAVLFVNVSVGGALTHFAAPPIVMVAAKWNWGASEVFQAFGIPALLTVFTNALLATIFLRHELQPTSSRPSSVLTQTSSSFWLRLFHLALLAVTVFFSHHPMALGGILLVFLTTVYLTRSQQDQLRWKESGLVGIFLGGLIVLGTPQAWWLQTLFDSLNKFSLYLSAAFLTAFTDNAALTYLGTQVPDLAPVLKKALVAGAIAGGGLTVIANAPNPIGYGILKDRLTGQTLSAWNLLKQAILPTIFALLYLSASLF